MILGQPRRFPEGACDLERVDPRRAPPLRLIAGAVEFAVVHPAQRHREFIADLTAQGGLLGESQVMRFGRLAPADRAWL